MLPCRSPACNRWFGNTSGLTKHMRTKHSFNQPQERPIPPPWGLDDARDDDPNPLPEDFDAVADVDDAHVQRDGEGEWEYHPLLRGAYSLLTT